MKKWATSMLHYEEGWHGCPQRKQIHTKSPLAPRTTTERCSWLFLSDADRWELKDDMEAADEAIYFCGKNCFCKMGNWDDKQASSSSTVLLEPMTNKLMKFQILWVVVVCATWKSLQIGIDKSMKTPSPSRGRTPTLAESRRFPLAHSRLPSWSFCSPK